jgi:hypothetical protein
VTGEWCSYFRERFNKLKSMEAEGHRLKLHVGQLKNILRLGMVRSIIENVGDF